jgi:hypothetical protein
VANSLKARNVESQQPAITRQWPANNRGMVFSAQSVPMAAHAIMKYVIPSLSKNCTATEELFYTVRAEMTDDQMTVSHEYVCSIEQGEARHRKHTVA